MLRENRNKTLKQIHDLQGNAKRYCFLIENIHEFDSQEWLTEVSLILPRIHAVMGMIDNSDRGECLFALSDIDERFDLFCHLKKVLGDKDAYEMGDELTENEMYGSLSGDLADLYFEIRRGLDLIRNGRENLPAALSLWRDGFFLHWGKHLIDAEKHLYDLRVHHQI
ncbi:MAG: hypothetical protein A6F70_05110 [Cycloclasticus sp. symbiont of Bathymodiolus heckerae]|nr:MAG: hypothetical protein A6F70_05110 [Cycloclasticus sp. symbiont of Bathymodiolus heckerae]